MIPLPVSAPLENVGPFVLLEKRAGLGLPPQLVRLICI